MRSDGSPPGYFQATVTSDDRVLFVSNQNRASITVVNLAEARHSGFSTVPVVGQIPVGYGSVTVSLSPDGRFLYTTVVVVAVARAIADPPHSVLATVAAGCDPVRLVLRPAGDRAYVTARSRNALLAFDAYKLATDSAHALLGTVGLRTGPVGIAVIESGRRLVVTNSTGRANVAADQLRGANARTDRPGTPSTRAMIMKA